MYLDSGQAYELSGRLVHLFEHQRGLLKNLLFQYKILCDNSPAGRGCHVAAQSLKIANQQKELQTTREYLRVLRTQADQIIREIERLEHL